MPAISSQYIFDLTISIPDLNKVIEHRIRTSHTTSEPLERTYARMLAYCHSYDPDLAISTDSSDRLEPMLSCRDLTGDIKTWIDIGCPSSKKFTKPIRSHKTPLVKLYFYRENHRDSFKREFHGFSKELFKNVLCYQFDPNFLTALTQVDKKTNVWNVTFLEDTTYIDANGVSFESTIEQVDLGAVI